ncbi:hypothetical protein L3Y34_019623 [Caenorhabditis briggsae]|uniref:Uncharacterized protein n=1 Tax=Caenorhabditis briggsae TaxID=6238 RepID=A0AAE9DQB0_CAEBR|nr:hypothetical protein L3Y34_019623 [Caenorhabditis briggsae]
MSGSIRTQIGLAKRRIKDALERITDLSTSEDLQTDEPQEIFEEIIDICDIADVLRTESERIRNLNNEWIRMIEIDALSSLNTFLCSSNYPTTDDFPLLFF